MLRYWPFLIPPLVFIVLVLLQPSDRMVLPFSTEGSGYPLHGYAVQWVTDDSDVLAFAMRAENAARGRKAGLSGPAIVDRRTGWTLRESIPTSEIRVVPIAPVPEYDRAKFAAKLKETTSFTERYFLEYPPAALYLFRLGLIGSGRSDTLNISPALLDSSQITVALHTPTTDDERTLYRAFRHATRVYWFVHLAALIGLMWLVHRGIGANGEARGPAWLFLLPGFLYFTPCRFDILPAALVLCSIAAADRRRVGISGLCLGAAAALKMYPLILAPLILRYLARSGWQAIVWCVAMALPMAFTYGPMYLTDGVEGILVPFQFQMSRNPELDWSFYGRLLPLLLTLNLPVMGIARGLPVLVAVLVMVVWRPRDVYSLLRRCAIAVIPFLTFQVFYSPQWWQWLAVLLVPLVPRHRWLLGPIIALDLLTYLHFPLLYAPMGTTDLPPNIGYPIRDAHVYTRAALWLVLVVAFVWQERKAKTTMIPHPALNAETA
jgi:hypothetical protein